MGSRPIEDFTSVAGRSGRVERSYATAVDGGVCDIPEDGLSQAEGHGYAWHRVEDLEKNLPTSEEFGGKIC